MKSGLCNTMPTVISSARVPIIKFQEEKTGVMVDISFECVSALVSTEVVKNYVKRYPMLRPLTLVLKYYLKHRYLNETWSGGIGSYTLVVMILSFLQMRTSTGGRTRNAGNGEDLSTLLLQFLQFYGSQFDYFHNVISVINGGSYLRKEDKNWTSEEAPDALSVEDPVNPQQDLAAGTYRFQDARAVFMEGFWRLTHESPRWSHTHSFLARLFDMGPLPDEAISSISSAASTSNIANPKMHSEDAKSLENSVQNLATTVDLTSIISEASAEYASSQNNDTSVPTSNSTRKTTLRGENVEKFSPGVSTEVTTSPSNQTPSNSNPTEAPTNTEPQPSNHSQKTPTRRSGKRKQKTPSPRANGDPSDSPTKKSTDNNITNQNTNAGANKNNRRKTPANSPTKAPQPSRPSEPPQQSVKSGASPSLDPSGPEYLPLFPALP